MKYNTMAENKISIEKSSDKWTGGSSADEYFEKKLRRIRTHFLGTDSQKWVLGVLLSFKVDNQKETRNSNKLALIATIRVGSTEHHPRWTPESKALSQKSWESSSQPDQTQMGSIIILFYMYIICMYTNMCQTLFYHKSFPP